MCHRTCVKKRLNYLLDAFDMTNAIGGLIEGYSHGMPAKKPYSLVHFCIILPVWILDEPMVGLDPRSAFQLKKMMREHCDQGHTVFFSTHVLEVAERLCDRIGIIDRGRLVACGTLEELRHGQRNESLEELFLQLTDEETVQGAQSEQQ